MIKHVTVGSVAFEKDLGSVKGDRVNQGSTAEEGLKPLSYRDSVKQ